jgi:hypothetical protein
MVSRPRSPGGDLTPLWSHLTARIAEIAPYDAALVVS